MSSYTLKVGMENIIKYGHIMNAFQIIIKSIHLKIYSWTCDTRGGLLFIHYLSHTFMHRMWEKNKTIAQSDETNYLICRGAVKINSDI